MGRAIWQPRGFKGGEAIISRRLRRRTPPGRAHELMDAGPESLQIGAFLVRPDLHRLSGPNGEQHLEPKVMGVLELLAARAGKVVTKEEMCASVWGGACVSDDAIVRCISKLRRCLGDCRHEQRVIETIPKRGYRLVAQVKRPQQRSGGAADRRSRLTLDAVLGSCSDHIYIYDRNCRYLHASRAGARAIGLEPEQMIGKTWRELGMPAEIMEPFQRQVVAVFDGGPSLRQPVSYPTIYGVRAYEYILDPILSPDGEVIAVMALVRDIDERGTDPGRTPSATRLTSAASSAVLPRKAGG